MSIARRSLQVVAFLCTLIVGATSMAVIVTQTTWFKEWLRGFIVKQAEDYVNGRLSIGRLDGNLFFGVELEDVDVTQNGKTVVGIKDLGLDYNALSFLSNRVVLDSIRLNRPVVLVSKTGDGWNVTQLIKARTPDPNQPKNRRPIEIGEIGVSDGTLLLEDNVAGTSGTIDAPSRIERLDASLGVASDEDELKVAINHLSMRATAPEFGVNALSGVVRRTPNVVTLENIALRTEETSLSVKGTIRNIESGTPVIDLQASSDKFDMGELAKVIPALRGYELQPAFDVRANGPLNAIKVDARAQERNVGKIAAAVTLDGQSPEQRVAGMVTMEHLNVAPLAKNAALKSDITGSGRIDLAFPHDGKPLSGTYDVAAQSVTFAGYQGRNVKAQGRLDGSVVRLNALAAAYGGNVTARGVVTIGSRLALDLNGNASNVDLRNLPASLRAPKVPSLLQFTYAVKGQGNTYSGDLTLGRSMLAGADIADGTTGTFRIGGGAPAYSAKGAVAGLDIQEVGRDFNIASLATDRYRSRIDTAFDLSGSGGGQYPLTIQASGTATDSELFGASFPRLDFTTDIGDGNIKATAVGQFANLDPAVVAENEKLRGMLSGALDVATTIHDYQGDITLQDVDLSGRVNLANSEIAGVAIETGAVEGNIAAGEGNLTQLAITGPDVTVQGQGAVALNDTGASNLTLHVESSSLERIGKIVNQPLSGSAVVDATVTGNAQSLGVRGTLKGSNIGYENNSALALDTTFDATVPNLTVADATVKTTSKATFLEAGGQQINEVSLDATYAMDRLQFKGLARQQMRELEAGGDLVLHPDHREVHLNALTLRTEGLQWSAAPGSNAAIQYGAGRVQVNNLTLVNGDQRISAEGALGSPSEQLRVTVQNVDVAQLDALFLNDQRLAGRLSANALVSGTTSAPKVAGDFTLSSGAFRDFTFQSFGGKVDYADSGITLDVRIQQTPQAWLTAKGYAPLSLFRGNPPELERAHDEPVSPAEAVNIEIASSEIDLGVVQGFTSYVTDVSGSLAANLRVTGSGRDPHVEGAVRISGGGFNVPELGTFYTGLDTSIQLTQDQVSITQMQLWDDHGQPLTIGGTLGVHERSVGAVDITLKSDTFEVLHNGLGRVRLDTDLHLTGELRKPRLEGSIDMHTATLNVDEVLNRIAAASPYSTTATDISSAEDGGMPVPSLFSVLDLNVGVAIPGNLVLNGQNVRPANSPIELGDMSITVGGAMQVRKAPAETLRLTGEVNTVRGSYIFQGRRFEIQRDGRIRFQGGDEIDPLLDVRASRVIAGVQTFVRIQGTMRQPELSFTSNPPLDQADILSLIVFNQPINELGEGQQASLANAAATFAGGYLTSGLTSSIRSALSLDEFQIQASGDQGGGPEVTLGEQIGDNLFFRLRQGFGTVQATELMLEYQIREFLRVQGSAADVQSDTQRSTFRRIERGGLDLIFFFSY